MKFTRRLWKLYKFRGEVITEGKMLKFKAYDKNGNLFDIERVSGIKVISLFPHIDTPVCDRTSKEVARLSKIHKNISFISICTNSITNINKWCLANGEENSIVLSDLDLGEFGKKTNTYIPKRKELGRGLIVLNDANKIISIRMNKDFKFAPDWRYVHELLGN